MVPAEKLESIVSKLSSYNFRISIDDFGTGYSSITHLQRLPVNSIKIDKSFVENIMTCQRDTLIVKSLINLAKDLNLNIIAEGVETQEQLQFLKDHNCIEAQGYYLNKPLSTKDISKLLTASSDPTLHDYFRYSSPKK